MREYNRNYHSVKNSEHRFFNFLTGDSGPLQSPNVVAQTETLVQAHVLPFQSLGSGYGAPLGTRVGSPSAPASGLRSCVMPGRSRALYSAHLLFCKNEPSLD